MLLDTLKGFVPALLAMIYVGHLAGVIAGAAAMLGHWRPLFLKFARGGKVVATSGGAFLGVAPLVGGIAAVVWIVVFAVCRYASVASISAAISLPVAAVVLREPWPVIVFAAFAALAVVVLHRPNISRLRAGTETRFRFRRSPAAADPTRCLTRGGWSDVRATQAKSHVRDEDVALPPACLTPGSSAEPLAQLGVVLRRRGALELGAQLAGRAVTLGDHVVSVNRLQVHLAREQEVAVAEPGVGRQGVAQRDPHGVLDEARLQMRVLHDEQLVGPLQQLVDR
jgi:glycerol-3-phosphate acyltransferase PlsY